MVDSVKASNYIVEFLEHKNVSHVFGYQGTMIAHFVDSLSKSKVIENHCSYNEQGAAFAACGYAKASGECGVAYSTSGPGCLNLVSGIADAFYDSTPVLFITGQVNTNEYTEISDLRQQAFQQTDIVSIVKPITKYAVFIDNVINLPKELERAWNIANSDRKGPVLIDVPMNIQRGDILEEYYCFEDVKNTNNEDLFETAKSIVDIVNESKYPVMMIGNGIGKSADEIDALIKLAKKWKIPVISSLLGKQCLPFNFEYNFGVIGSAYGDRYANLIAYDKADLILGLGISLIRRQIGSNSELFAKNARIIRVDIDPVETSRKVHLDETVFNIDVNRIIPELEKFELDRDYSKWLSICDDIRNEMRGFDISCEETAQNRLISKLGNCLNEDAIVSVDVGQHMMWTMKGFNVRKNRLVFSGGHGAMGFSLPAAIGAYYAFAKQKQVVCFAGDGSLQMNIQELQWISRERIPICIFVFNNNCLGLIRQQQEDFFDSNLAGSHVTGGYLSPNFCEIATAYKINSIRIGEDDILTKDTIERIGREPLLIEVVLNDNTLAMPKTYFGDLMINQRPYLPKDVFEKVMGE